MVMHGWAWPIAGVHQVNHNLADQTIWPLGDLWLCAHAWWQGTHKDDGWQWLDMVIMVITLCSLTSCVQMSHIGEVHSFVSIMITLMTTQVAGQWSWWPAERMWLVKKPGTVLDNGTRDITWSYTLGTVVFKTWGQFCLWTLLFLCFIAHDVLRQNLKRNHDLPGNGDFRQT